MAGRNDIVLTMGAGDVNRICRALVEGHDDTSPKPAVRPRKRKGR
jgi:hypothetical protein